MQTFLPFEDFVASARALDRKRLGKQRVECKQILRAMYRASGWANHPAVRMWRSHGATLLRYYDAICKEWKARGYQHAMSLDADLVARARLETTYPVWLGVPVFHRMHQLTLLRKDPVHYAPYFRAAGEAVIPHYLWPVDKHGALTSEYVHYQSFRVRYGHDSKRWFTA